MKRKEPSVVWVEWDDSASRNGWTRIEHVAREKGMVCRSIGFLLAQDRTAITLSTSVAYGDDDQLDRVSAAIDPITIPRKAIRSLRRLRRGSG